MSGKSIASMTVQDILEHAPHGISGEATEREQFELPNTTLKIEPGGAIDSSGSNAGYSDPDHTITKVDLVAGAIPYFVEAVEGDDSQAASEVGTGNGGWRAFGFCYDGPIIFRPGEDESDDPRDFHDMNSKNVVEKVQRYRHLVSQQGLTYAAPALIAIDYCFTTEFGDDMTRAQVIQVVGDGEFSDPKAVDKFLATANPRRLLSFTAVGYGDEHKAFVAHLKDISDSNPYFTFANCTGYTDPYQLALSMRLLSGTTKMQ